MIKILSLGLGRARRAVARLVSVSDRSSEFGDVASLPDTCQTRVITRLTFAFAEAR